MVSQTTHNIKISVKPEYDTKNSYPSANRFVFRYNIAIENFGTAPVQLLKRKWRIHDTGFGFSEVAGEGVIGLLPIIDPEADFTYFSHVVLRSGMGNMSGIYLFKNMLTEEVFEVPIPKFELVSLVLNN